VPHGNLATLSRIESQRPVSITCSQNAVLLDMAAKYHAPVNRDGELGLAWAATGSDQIGEVLKKLRAANIIASLAIQETEHV
jgi:hypothetical protein